MDVGHGEGRKLGHACLNASRSREAAARSLHPPPSPRAGSESRAGSGWDADTGMMLEEMEGIFWESEKEGNCIESSRGAAPNIRPVSLHPSVPYSQRRGSAGRLSLGSQIFWMRL